MSIKPGKTDFSANPFFLFQHVPFVSLFQMRQLIFFCRFFTFSASYSLLTSTPSQNTFTSLFFSLTLYFNMYKYMCVCIQHSMYYISLAMKKEYIALPISFCLSLRLYFSRVFHTGNASSSEGGGSCCCCCFLAAAQATPSTHTQADILMQITVYTHTYIYTYPLFI